MLLLPFLPLFFHMALAALQKLPSGLWNCSVDNYSFLRANIECNLKTECEDGRDETEHCPFSSPDCQGMIALCGHCYSFVHNLPELNSFIVDVVKVSEKHCSSLGGTMDSPLCVYNWYDTILGPLKKHPSGWSKFWFGMVSNDLSAPPMYRHAAFNKKLMGHHIFHGTHSDGHNGQLRCHFANFVYSQDYISHACVVKHLRPWDYRGILCAFPTNMTSIESLYLKPVSLNNTQFMMTWQQDPMTVCYSGHVTYTFLVCGFHRLNVCSQNHTSCHFYHNSSQSSQLHSADKYAIEIPMFTCNDDVTTLSYSLVCNFIHDCHESSDESFCTHPSCIKTFTCTNGECISFSKVCDQISDCWDDSEEHGCISYRSRIASFEFYPSPVLVSFDGISQFRSIPMYSNESCPESHYRCPGEFNDCLPVYTQCNGIYDCVDLKDEDGCGDMVCLGFFKCRASTTCLHADHLCDGWPHCPMRDDEIVCDTSCPVHCLCQSHTFFCPKTFSVAQFPYVRSLDATNSGMTFSDVSKLTYLIHLVLAQCSLTVFPPIKMLNLNFLDLSRNKLQQVNMTVFLGMENLRTLSLSLNPITFLSTGLPTGVQHNNLMLVDLSFTALTVFDSRVFSLFLRMQKLNLTFTSVYTISPSGFQFTPQLVELHMDGSPVTDFPHNMFHNLPRLRVVSTDNFKICCKQILLSRFHDTVCHTPEDEISSCEDLLQSWFYRVFLWLITCLSMSGNLICFCARLLGRNMTLSSGFSVFVFNLTMADFLMGIYVAIIGIADEEFRGRYLHLDNTWKHSIACKVAGSLCLLSSEVSALIIWLITLDRFLVLHFPFSTVRFGRISAAVVCLLTWSVGLILALLPFLPVLSHWEFYSQTGICMPLPVTKQNFEGKEYSFSLLIILNFIIFLFISGGQALIYWSIQSNAFKNNSTKVSRDMIIARRLITVALTDLMCWFPIGLCGMLALAGIPIPGEVNVALAIFVLPLNSAINPFMYTFNTLAEKRRKSNEAKLLEWVESHVDITDAQLALV